MQTIIKTQRQAPPGRTPGTLSSTPPDALAPGRMGPLALWLPLLFALAGAISLLIDTRVAFWSKNVHWSGTIRALLETSQSFGNGLGVLVIALAIFQLDPARRWALPRMLAAALGSGLSADILKTFVVRLRPRWFDLLQRRVAYLQRLGPGRRRS